jgi:ankyrin repeat protein
LENGAHVNSANGRISGYNALIAASERGYKDIVQLLLDNGADVNSNDGYHNALFRAAEWGDIESMQLLFDYGANFCPPNNLPEQDLPLDPTVEYYSNALDAASRQGHEGIVRLLLERGAIWPDESSRSDFSADDPSVHDSGSP